MKLIQLGEPVVKGSQRNGETRTNSRLHDVRNFRISLKQWRILHAVIDCGGFSGAANHLHVSQSAISYTIAKLQDQLGIALLKMEGRKASLTEDGRTLLTRSRNLIREAIELEAFAENLRQGWGREVRLVVDHNFPTHLLMLALRKFSLLRCSTKVRLSEVTMPQAKKALFDHTADLAISSQIPSGFMGDALIELEYIPVAHPDHALFRLGRNVLTTDLERQLQIVLYNSKDPLHVENKNIPLGYLQPWHVSSFDTAVGALLEGLGYAWLPRHRMQKWLDRGQLQILPLDEGRTYKANLYLIHGKSWGQDSGVRRLAEMLHSLAASGPGDFLRCDR
jgi:DNA-binding transcriptional LysR family regulator